MSAREPTPEALPGEIARRFAATRPAFLCVTVVGALLGMASAVADRLALRPLESAAAVVAAVIAHAGVNVINDYFDAANGSDAANAERLFPYTGGSRMIQNGVLSMRETWVLGVSLLALVLPAGLWLAWQAGAGLIAIGAAGLAIGWAYSAPPLALMSRGFGEAGVAAGFLLVVAGADYVQRSGFALTPWVAGLPYALLVTNLLFVNEFPDVRADGAAGKRNLVVRLGPHRARWGYAAIALGAYAALAAAVASAALPPLALAGLLALPASAFAAWRLLRHAGAPKRLAPAIRATIAAAHIEGVLVAAALFVSRGEVLA